MEVIFANLLSAPVLFFLLGVAACLCKSDLDFPQPLPKLFSLYLLFAIGYKGGLGLAGAGFNSQMVTTLALCLVLSMAHPLALFFLLKRWLDAANAAAVAACYGSISAVTFIAATSFLKRQEMAYDGYMVAAMALMESPAIVVGIALARHHGVGDSEAGGWKKILHEAFLNGSVVVLTGSLAIGYLTRDSSGAVLQPFTQGIFQGVLCLFLLDMGIVAARRLGSLRDAGPVVVVGTGLVFPLAKAALAIGLCVLMGLELGNALLFTVLAASASYIAVPAAIRLALPEANPGLYIPLALTVTFPFNIALGIPLYHAVLERFLS
jgi:hypothetical protein